MSEIAGIIDTLESRIAKLLDKMAAVEAENSRLKESMVRQQAQSDRQVQEIAALQQSISSLRLANSLLGSEENKRDTKLKINSLIREIDYCIAQLAD